MRPMTIFLSVLLSVNPLLAQKTDTVKRTRTVTLSEHAGVARTQAPVEVTVRFETDALKQPGAIRLFRVDGGGKVPVPYQVLQVTPQSVTDSFAPTPQTFVRLVFLADVAANGSATYEVSLEGQAASLPAATLKVGGEAVARTIDTGPAIFDLHKPSGQLLSITPKLEGAARLVFLQFQERGPIPIHWNPDIWAVGRPWGHTNSWNTPVLFDPAQHKAEVAPAGTDKTWPYFYQESSGPLLHRLTRWGKMPFAAKAEASVTYTFFAGAPFLLLDSLLEFPEVLSVHAVRNAELVFSRHQFDTAVWMTKEGKLLTAPAYDYADRDRSFGEIAKLPANVPCLGFANERKGFGIALVTLGVSHHNKFIGHSADEQAHFYIRDYDEHGKGSPANFLYLVRPVVYRNGYLPTYVPAGSFYAEKSAVVVFRLQPDRAKRYEELLRWQKMLANPLEVVVD